MDVKFRDKIYILSVVHVTKIVHFLKVYPGTRASLTSPHTHTTPNPPNTLAEYVLDRLLFLLPPPNTEEPPRVLRRRLPFFPTRPVVSCRSPSRSFPSSTPASSSSSTKAPSSITDPKRRRCTNDSAYACGFKENLRLEEARRTCL